MRRRIRLTTPVWPLRDAFTISRGSKTEARTVVVEIAEDGAAGHAECTPYPRYDETVEGVLGQIRAIEADLAAGLDRRGVAERLPAGAARNAVDCALWDLEAKLAGRPVWALAGLAAPQPLVTAYTISLDTAERMGEAARANADRPLLKLKLSGEGDLERVEAVRAGAPGAQLIVDANEAWSVDRLDRYAEAFASLGVTLIEQPLPAASDAALIGRSWPVPLCADESCHDRASLEHCADRYQAVNIKLDKTGGLTEALALRDAAVARGLAVMVGCMMASSLAMAPATLLAQGAAVVDLDGPLWLARDAEPPIVFAGSRMMPPDPALWG
jgi:L-alanine-DL-glutamate epimerase-like enolase superfamily enzyme